MSLEFHIGINARRANAEGWGDQSYALALAQAFRGLGHGAAVFYREETPALTGKNDVVIRIIGPHLDEPVPGVPNLLWIISPPNLAPLATLRRYQAVYFASEPMARIYTVLGVPSACLQQATDGSAYNAQALRADVPRYDVTFVGNLADRARRGNVRRAIEAGFDVKVWGQGWEGVIPARNHMGTRVDTAALVQIYAGSRVVLNSHMPAMAQLGFMSNRSFDALSCGACVISDRVAGFVDPALPWLMQVRDDTMGETLERVLAEAPTRADVAATLGDRYSFAARARVLAEAAERLLAADKRAVPAFVARPLRPPGKTPQAVTVCDVDEGEPAGALAARLDGLLAGHALDLTLTLSDPSVTPPDLSPAQAMQRVARAVLRIGAVLERAPALAALRVRAPEAEAQQGIVHAAMADHRAAQVLALAGAGQMEPLCARARRLLDVDLQEAHPLGWPRGLTDPSQRLFRYMINRPLYAHSPEGFARDKGKRHLVLWPKAAAPAQARPVGVFLHLFYPDLAPVFRDRLAVLGVPHRIHISTDTEAKAAVIRAVFPEAQVRVLPNRGRDVFPKLCGFADAHAAHDIVLHLHGKKSAHSGRLDQWLQQCLDCLLPPSAEVNRILSLFDAVADLGMVAPLTYQAVLGAAHWGDNQQIAQELALRMGLEGPLPDDTTLEFPVGSMFWARTAALRPLLELGLQDEHFPPEAGQVDATPAHAVERLFGVVCRATGHRLIRVAAAGSRAHKAHQVAAKSNGEVRAALARGALGG
jgi:hypothetical protein